MLKPRVGGVSLELCACHIMECKHYSNKFFIREYIWSSITTRQHTHLCFHPKSQDSWGGLQHCFQNIKNMHFIFHFCLGPVSSIRHSQFYSYKGSLKSILLVAALLDTYWHTEHWSKGWSTFSASFIFSLFDITFMQKCDIFLDNREKWDNWRLHALAAEDVAVLCHVSRWIKKILKVSEVLLILAG